MSKGSNRTPSITTRWAYADRILRARRNYGNRLKPLVVHRWVQMALDGLCGAVAVTIAYLLRFDMHIPGGPYRIQVDVWVALLFFLQPLAIGLFGGYLDTWQHFGIRDLGRIASRLAGLSVLLLLMGKASPHLRVMPYGVAFGYFLVSLILTAGIRTLRRFDHELFQRLGDDNRILIIGTTHTIAHAIRQLRPLYGSSIVGVIIQDVHLRKQRIGGVPVLGDTTQLKQLIYKHGITLIFVSSADLDEIPEVMQDAAEMEIAVKLLPSVQDLLDNRVRISKNVTVAALRSPSEALAGDLHPAVRSCLEGQIVLVTGAAGSIGSELVRQSLLANVKRLLVLDQDENGIFELMTELGALPNVTPVIADIRDGDTIRSLFNKERPQVVLHAAAYKHVPLMESHPSEAVLNNVIGTRNLAEAAVEFHADRMVMISSDKAVRPSSIMGATKRLAEVVIQDLAERTTRQGSSTQFACVRFGNVLGSRGSVLKLFLKQIEAGGPITITHEDMTRYFMTIPQAVGLVLQAATLGSCGHIYMLDMGDPVRIVNLARKVIHIAGLQPDKDIEIRVVGSRPGEKLHEQLWSEDAKVTPTEFEQVFQVAAETSDAAFPDLLAQLEHAARAQDDTTVRAMLHHLPISYLTAPENAAPQPVAIL